MDSSPSDNFSESNFRPLSAISPIRSDGPHGTTLVIGVIVGILCILRVAWLAIRTHLRTRDISEEHNCEPITNVFPQNRWLFGLDFVLKNIKENRKNNYLEYAQACYQEHGNTWTANALGTTMIESIEPENLKAVFSSDFATWQQGAFRIDTFKPLLGEGILSANGPAWEHSRALIKSAFKSYTADTTLYETHIQNLIAALPKDETEIVDLQNFFLKLTMDISTDVLFGTSALSLVPGTVDFTSAYEVVKSNIFKNMQIYPLHVLRDLRAEKAATRKVHDFVDHFISTALDAAASGKDEGSLSLRYKFLHQMAQELGDRTRLRMELLSLLLAGRDTTAALVTNLFYILAQREDIRRSIQTEVAALDGRLPKADDLKRMHYLNCTLKESLRLHPVTPINSRTASRATTLPLGGGPNGTSPIHIPAGAQFVTSIHALHRRPDLWGADAAEFKPERWAGDAGGAGKVGGAGKTAKAPPPWHYMPFLGGPRACPGQGLAVNIALYTVVRMLQCFGDVVSAESEEWRGAIAVTCWNVNGARVRLVPRG